MLAADTGKRPNSELFPLQWSKVHLESSPDAPQGFVRISAGKTDAARIIPLTARTREMLLIRGEMTVGAQGAERRCGDLWPYLVTVQHAHERAAK